MLSLKILSGVTLPMAMLATSGDGMPESAPRMGVWGLEGALITGSTEVVSNKAGPTSSIGIRVVVGVDGTVVDARVGENFQKLDPGPALAAARTWHFRPQTFEDRPIVAVGSLNVYYRPPETPPRPASWPETDPADFSITLERGACYGSCPDYKVTISGDGTIRFTTQADVFAGTATEAHRQYNGQHVLLPGDHVAHIDPARAFALLERFKAAGFMGLKPAYESMITDSSTYSLTVRVGKVSRRVVDYVGEGAGMPAFVTELENAVDEAADSDRWVSGNARTVDWLGTDGFDFRSADASRLAQAAAGLGTIRGMPDKAAALINGLIDKGLALDTMTQGRDGDPPAPLGALLTAWAADAGQEPLFDRLLRAGYLKQLDPARLSRVFAGEMGCSPDIARALAAAGADPAKGSESGTALTALRSSYSACAKMGEAQTLAMAETLIELGVPLEARDELGWTALMGCESPALAWLLLARGADPNARDKNGTTPVLSTDDDRVALILLRAGADPRAKDENGSVRDQAKKGTMPATLAWLDQHGIP